ncbi:MAG: hypothetical protein V4459_09555 [Pseudomonadota bacterium]
MLKSVIGAAAALSMAVMPIAANASPANPAASLSLGKNVRAGASSSKANKFGGGALYAVLVIAGVAAIIAIGTKDNSPKSP